MDAYHGAVRAIEHPHSSRMSDDAPPLSLSLHVRFFHACFSLSTANLHAHVLRVPLAFGGSKEKKLHTKRPRTLPLEPHLFPFEPTGRLGEVPVQSGRSVRLVSNLAGRTRRTKFWSSRLQVRAASRRRWPCSQGRRRNCCERPFTRKNWPRTTCVGDGWVRELAGMGGEWS